MPYSLSAQANLNAQRVADEARALIIADDSGTLEPFAQSMGRANAATNVFDHKISAFDSHGSVLDARALAIAASATSGDGLEEFRSSQGEFYVDRQAFEDLWLGGRRIVYFALNAGGLGADQYGAYCICVDLASSRAKRQVAMFPGNTVLLYGDGEGVIDITAVMRDVVPWASRADIATVRFGSDVQRTVPAKWAGLICRGQEFIEITVTPGPVIAEVSEVRMAAGRLKVMEDAHLDYVIGEALNAQDLRAAQIYEVLLRWSTEHNCRIVGIE